MDNFQPSDPRVSETARLIASDKVEGSAVRRSNGDKIGKIQRLMLDKRNGHVTYAVMTFGGFLGMGEDYYALPWNVLKYNETLDAYELNLTDDQLRGAPGYSDAQSSTFGNAAWEKEVHDYYGVPPYWM